MSRTFRRTKKSDTSSLAFRFGDHCSAYRFNKCSGKFERLTLEEAVHAYEKQVLNFFRDGSKFSPSVGRYVKEFMKLHGARTKCKQEIREILYEDQDEMHFSGDRFEQVVRKSKWF